MLPICHLACCDKHIVVVVAGMLAANPKQANPNAQQSKYIEAFDIFCAWPVRVEHSLDQCRSTARLT